MENGVKKSGNFGLKRINVEIDQSSWGGKYAFPGQLKTASSYPTIDFASALLWMGVAPLVQTVPRWWTAIRWAQMKYAYAVDDISDLRVRWTPSVGQNFACP